MASQQKDKGGKKHSSAVESLVSGRAPRATAGNRLGQLLTEETEDDFYKTAFGGFAEDSGDEEYETEDDAGDFVDSDFDRDEDEERAEDAGSDFEEPAKKRARGTTYKDPRAKKPTAESSRKRISTPKKPSAQATAVPAVTAAAAAPSENVTVKAEKESAAEAGGATRKSYRLATVEQRREHQKRQMESLSKPKKTVKVVHYRKLSQEELLAEAVETERENLASLAAYRRLEEERKKNRAPKRRYNGPTIRFLSTTATIMPRVTVVAGSNSSGDSSENDDSHAKPQQRYCRNFLSFSKDAPDFLVPSKPCAKKPEPAMCPITGLPAKYRDPVTGTAYASAEAFHMIRTSYARNQHRLQQGGQEKT